LFYVEVKMPIVRAHIYVSGRVQGVFFRAFTKREALRLGLRGWVKNQPDGRVEAVIEGERRDVDVLIQLCQNGPPLAIVRDIHVNWEPPTNIFTTFSIKY
jgi:acylphosphatase